MQSRKGQKGKREPGAKRIIGKLIGPRYAKLCIRDMRTANACAQSDPGLYGQLLESLDTTEYLSKC